jgi:hypothetical protein
LISVQASRMSAGGDNDCEPGAAPMLKLALR